VRKFAAVAIIFFLVINTSCRRTDEPGEFEVDRPTVGTTTDTIRTPTISTEERQVTVPDVDVTRDTARVRVPVVK
jgi:hypothetical protein